MYGYLPPISETIQIRRTRHAGYYRRSKNDLLRDVLVWIRSHEEQVLVDQLELIHNSSLRMPVEDQSEAMYEKRMAKEGQGNLCLQYHIMMMNSGRHRESTWVLYAHVWWQVPEAGSFLTTGFHIMIARKYPLFITRYWGNADQPGFTGVPCKHPLVYVLES